MAAFFTLGVRCGLWRGEVAALQWKDIDFEGKSVLVCRSLYRDQDGTHRFKSPKTGIVRRVPLNELALRALRTHRASQAEHILRHRNVYDADAGPRVCRSLRCAVEPLSNLQRFPPHCKGSGNQGYAPARPVAHLRYMGTAGRRRHSNRQCRAWAFIRYHNPVHVQSRDAGRRGQGGRGDRQTA